MYGKPIRVPINEDAPLRVLKARKPAYGIAKEFAENTAASHLVMAGTGLKDVQEILGHKTMTMTLRYAHLSQEHKKKAINLLNGLTAPSNDYGTNYRKSPEVTKKEAAMNG